MLIHNYWGIEQEHDIPWFPFSHFQVVTAIVKFCPSVPVMCLEFWKIVWEWVQIYIHKEKKCSQKWRGWSHKCSLDSNLCLPRISSTQTYFVTQRDFVMWYLCTVVRLAVFWEPDKWSVSREHSILWLGSFSLQDVWKHVIWGWVALRFCGHWVIWCCSGVRWNGCIAPVSL